MIRRVRPRSVGVFAGLGDFGLQVRVVAECLDVFGDGRAQLVSDFGGGDGGGQNSA